MALAFAHWVIRWRWLIIISTLLIIGAIGSGTQYIEFSGSYRAYFSKENPQLTAFDQLQNTYSKNDNVMFVVAPKDGKVFTRETLATVKWLTEQGWKTPFSKRVDSITNFQYTRAENDDLVVKNLVENPSTLTEEGMTRIKQVALTDPLLLNRLISSRAHVTGINVTVILPEKTLTETTEVMVYARKLAEHAKADNPNIDIYITGMLPFNNAFQEASQKDLETLVPIMYGIIFLVAALTLRSISSTIATLLVIIFSVIAALGMMGWLGIPLSAPTATAPTVILTIAVADSIHVLLTMLHGMRTGLRTYSISFSPLLSNRTRKAKLTNWRLVLS